MPTVYFSSHHPICVHKISLIDGILFLNIFGIFHLVSTCGLFQIRSLIYYPLMIRVFVLYGCVTWYDSLR